MPTDFGDYSLDDPPVCPKCYNDRDLGIFAGGYYCLDCGYPFKGFQSYSMGRPALTLPDAQLGKFRLINCKEYTVTQSKQKEYTNNVVDISTFSPKPKVEDTTNPAHGHLQGILPDDYEECCDCGFDHTYDPAAAGRWHEAHSDNMGL